MVTTMPIATKTRRQPPSRLDHDPRRLRRARVERGLTIAQAAEKSGISPQMWSHLERGERNLSAPTLKRIAESLGVKTTDLMPPEPVAA